MKINGTVEDVIYRNSENGYTILKVLSSGTSIVVAGKCAIASKGETIEAEGEYKMNKRYGENFMADTIRLYAPTDLNLIIKYLSSGLISGVGEKTASNIVSKFGQDTFKVIEEYPFRLAEIKGISARKANEIHNTYTEIRKMQDAVMFLQKYDISITTAIKIYSKYKNKTEQVLLENPYRLIEDIEGIGFKTADKIAMKLGIKFDSEKRIKAGVVYALTEYAEKQGSTVVYKDDLYASTIQVLELDETYSSNVESAIVDLEISGAIRAAKLNGEPVYAIGRYYSMEDYIAKKLINLCENSNTTKLGTEQDIEHYELQNNIKLHENQKKAVLSGVNQGVSIITGGPGTGKTTIIKCILNIFKNNNLKVMLMAPTGRAAKRLEEQTGDDASTIHRALEANFSGIGRGFARNENNPLEADAIIVDEVSMLDVFLMSSLLKALNFGTRLILVGDKDQLPSVGAGNVLADLIASEQFEVTELTQIYRQSEDSMIVVNAHKINESEMPDLSIKSSDFFYSSTSEPTEVANEIVSLITERMPKYFTELSSSDIQVIAPMKAGVAGVDNLNLLLQATLNPESPEKKQIELTKRIFREGDKVMQIVNNYDHEWAKYTDGEGVVYGSGIFNGDMGNISKIYPETSEVYVVFDDGREACYSVVDLEEIVLSYAITIHKSQGSEFPAVIIPIMGGSPLLMNKNLLYTAVTRAKRIVVLIGKQGNIYYMIKNKLASTRLTMLKSMIEKYMNQGLLD